VRGIGKRILWPVYFDSVYSRNQGRRVSKNLSVRSVKAEEVFRAADDLGLNPILESGASYPKNPGLQTGLIRIDQAGIKTGVLKELAQGIRFNRNRK
jgi:signal recognition particle subunit SRP19